MKTSTLIGLPIVVGTVAASHWHSLLLTFYGWILFTYETDIEATDSQIDESKRKDSQEAI